MIFPTLYNVDSKDKVRLWYMETNDEGSHRVVSGLQDGKLTTTDWKLCKAKNVGKKNATTPEEQAQSEIDSLYTKKLERKYYRSLAEAEEAGSGMKFFSPMLAVKWKDVESKVDLSKGYWIQPKLDGLRASLSEEDGVLSRGGKQFPACVHVSEALAEAFRAFPGLRLDGELYNHEFHDDFDEITSLVKQTRPTAEDLENAAAKVEYHVYDVPSHPGTFSARLEFLLHEVLPRINSQAIQMVETWRVDSVEHMDERYGRWLADGYEGLMLRSDEPYLMGPKRDARLIKRKEFMDEEFELDSVHPGKGNWSNAVKMVKFILPNDVRKEDGERPEAGVRGKKEYLAEVLQRSLKGDQPTHATIRFPSYTPRGIPRFAQVVKFYWGDRDD